MEPGRVLTRPVLIDSTRLVLFKFKIEPRVEWKVIATDTCAHGNFIRLTDQRQFGSFIRFVHDHLPPFLKNICITYSSKTFFQAARSSCSNLPAARLRNHNSSRMICRNWDALQSIPTYSRSKRERMLVRSTIPRSTKCSCFTFSRLRANGRSASCHGVLNRPLERRSRSLGGHRSEKAERINRRGSSGRQRMSVGTVVRNSTSGR